MQRFRLFSSLERFWTARFRTQEMELPMKVVAEPAPLVPLSDITMGVQPEIEKDANLPSRSVHQTPRAQRILSEKQVSAASRPVVGIKSRLGRQKTRKTLSCVRELWLHRRRGPRLASRLQSLSPLDINSSTASATPARAAAVERFDDKYSNVVDLLDVDEAPAADREDVAPSKSSVPTLGQRGRSSDRRPKPLTILGGRHLSIPSQ